MTFDIIGSREKAVAIMEKASKKKAEDILKKHKNIVSVLTKTSPRTGVYRTRKLRLVAGERNTVVIHKESGCIFMVDPRKVYFSPREATERIRIAEKIKPGEDIMVFFAGIGPFPIIISKKTKARKITGIEINPAAVKYFRKNIEINKTLNVEAVSGDVIVKTKKYENKFDRILMPLPEKSLLYLEDAFVLIKKKGIIHLYFFSKENEIDKIKTEVKNKAEKQKKKIRIKSVSRVLPYGPRIWKMRMDMEVV